MSTIITMIIIKIQLPTYICWKVGPFPPPENQALQKYFLCPKVLKMVILRKLKSPEISHPAENTHSKNDLCSVSTKLPTLSFPESFNLISWVKYVQRWSGMPRHSSRKFPNSYFNVWTNSYFAGNLLSKKLKFPFIVQRKLLSFSFCITCVWGGFETYPTSWIFRQW